MRFTRFNARWSAAAVTIWLLATHNLFAQPVRTTEFDLNPSWVNMMSDPDVNYFAAVKAYDDFWKGKEKPSDEAEEMEMRSNSTAEKMSPSERKKMQRNERAYERELKRESQRKLTESDLKQLEWKREMTYQCKRFEDWKRTVLPYVQNDGHILTAEERRQLDVQRSQDLLKSNEKK